MLTTIRIDYSETQCIATRLQCDRGIAIDTVWPALGKRPLTHENRLRPVPEGPFVVINGSGNYHHETYPIVEGLCRRASCSYVHIDAHPDKDTYFRWKLDCASFVGAIMEIPEIDEAVVLGLHLTPDLQDLPGLILGNDINYYRCDFFAKLRQYHARPCDIAEAHFRYRRHDGIRARANPAVQQARARRLPRNPQKKNRGLVVGWHDLALFDPASLGGEQVYLSIDLDVLRDAVWTDWRRLDPQTDDTGLLNQGDLLLDELLSLIDRIGAARQIIGADFCGLSESIEQQSEAVQQRSLDAIVRVYDHLVAAIEGRPPP